MVRDSSLDAPALLTIGFLSTRILAFFDVPFKSIYSYSLLFTLSYSEVSINVVFVALIINSIESYVARSGPSFEIFNT